MTTPPPRRDARSTAARYSTWLNLVNRLLGSNCLFNVRAEGNKCLVPAPWKIDDALSVPYGRADVPFLKRLLFGSDGSKVCKSLEALVERAHDRYKAMDMLRLDVLSPLNRLTRHAEPFVRQRCCVLIRVLAGQPLGKVSVVRNAALVRNVLELTADPEYAVRFHCAAALMALAEHRPGNEAMVASGCAERVLHRLRVEQDDRVVPALLRVVGRLTAASGRGGGGEGMGLADGATCGRPADFADLSSPGAGPRNGAEAGALLDCGGDGGSGPWTGRGLFEYLKRGARSTDYRTAVDSVACLSRGAAALREANEYLAGDRDTVDLLVSFASSPGLRGRALQAFSAQLLCAAARTTAGLANLKAAAAADWTSDGDDFGGHGGGASLDAATARCLRKLARALRPRDSDTTDRLGTRGRLTSATPRTDVADRELPCSA